MNYAASLIKSVYKGSKSTIKYYFSDKSYNKDTPDQDKSDQNEFNEIKTKYSWLSCVIFYRNSKNKYVVDQACIILGNSPPSYHAFFTNFTGWSVNDNKLYLNNTEIDYKNVYIHIRVGNTIGNINDIDIRNPNYYFPNNNKISKLIGDQIISKIKVYDISNDYGLLCNEKLEKRIRKIIDPRFLTYKHQIYGRKMENKMYNGLNLSVL